MYNKISLKSIGRLYMGQNRFFCIQIGWRLNSNLIHPQYSYYLLDDELLLTLTSKVVTLYGTYRYLSVFFFIFKVQVVTYFGVLDYILSIYIFI